MATCVARLLRGYVPLSLPSVKRPQLVNMGDNPQTYPVGRPYCLSALCALTRSMHIIIAHACMHNIINSGHVVSYALLVFRSQIRSDHM